jgi:hypothetical protein
MEAQQTITLKAAADLSSYQYYAMKVSAAETCNVQTSQGGVIVGVLQNTPEINEAGTVAISGVSFVVAKSAITVGDNLTNNADGSFETAASGDYIHGIALEAATAAGDIIRALISFKGRVA